MTYKSLKTPPRRASKASYKGSRAECAVGRIGCVSGVACGANVDYARALLAFKLATAGLSTFVEPRVAPSWCARVDGNKRKMPALEAVLRVSGLAP